MKEQHNKDTINKIVYFALTSTAETSWGCDQENRAPPHHHFFLSFFLFFLVSCPSSLRSFLFDEVVGVQRDAARLGYRLSTKHHGKSKLWLIRRAGRLVCLHVLRRLPPDPCVLILGGAVIPGPLKTSKVRNGKLKPFTDVLAHARSLLSSPHANQDVCSEKKRKKPQRLVKLQEVQQTHDSIQLVRVLLRQPRLQERVTTRGQDVKEQCVWTKTRGKKNHCFSFWGGWGRRVFPLCVCV